MYTMYTNQSNLLCIGYPYIQQWEVGALSFPHPSPYCSSLIKLDTGVVTMTAMQVRLLHL